MKRQNLRLLVILILVGTFVSAAVLVTMCGLWPHILDGLRAVNAYNPMQLAFLVSFEVLNSSGQDVDIMPIGMITVTGQYAPLPRYRDEDPPAILVTNKHPIQLKAESRTTITYDYDDINFRHILVRDKAGVVYILDTDKKGTKDSAYGPQKAVYEIPALDKMAVAPEELLPCLDGHRVHYSNAKEYPDNQGPR